MAEDLEDQLTRAAIEYHRYPTPGKISVTPTKSMTNQRDLSLAYSPGVAAACMAIARDPAQSHNLTSRANLVAVVSNGTAVLGLGNICALAGKPAAYCVTQKGRRDPRTSSALSALRGVWRGPLDHG